MSGEQDSTRTIQTYREVMKSYIHAIKTMARFGRMVLSLAVRGIGLYLAFCVFVFFPVFSYPVMWYGPSVSADAISEMEWTIVGGVQVLWLIFVAIPAVYIISKHYYNMDDVFGFIEGGINGQ